MTEKQRLQLLVEQLPDDEVHTALRFVESLTGSADPVASAFDAAPVDDEPLTPAERKAIDETESELGRHDLVSHQDARRILLS